MPLKTPFGYIQQSPWLTIANKQLELMQRYMSDLGLSPASRTRVDVRLPRRPSKFAGLLGGLTLSPADEFLEPALLTLGCKENVCPRKERPENRLTAPVALIMALGRHMVFEKPLDLDAWLANPGVGVKCRTHLAIPPCLTIVNKQLELLQRCMSDLGFRPRPHPRLCALPRTGSLRCRGRHCWEPALFEMLRIEPNRARTRGSVSWRRFMSHDLSQTRRKFLLAGMVAHPAGLERPS